jgi:hypothetical protein
MAIGDTVTGGTQGSVLFVGPSSVLAQNNSSFYWDNSTQSLGIGTTSPNNGLTVQKNISSGTVRIDAINTNTTGSGANAQMTVRVGGANAGDAVTIYEVNGVMSWIVGLDNSESDIFKIASNVAAVVTTGLAVTTDGKVGVNELNPTARLHLPAGTASVAPLKLTAGISLTTPASGAVEFDGSELFFTAGTIRRPLETSLEIANVLDFGAKGDGTTDDAAAIQAAVDSLADLNAGDGNGTGGIVYFPANRIYKVNSSITIQSNRAIWIVSDMHHGMLEAVGGGQGESYGNGYIVPGGDITGGIFHWSRPGANLGRGGGGGLFHVAIADPPTIGFSLGRQRTLGAAVFVEDAIYFDVENCYFSNLRGSAIRIGRVTVCRVHSGRIYRCGDTDEPAVHVHGSAGFAGAYLDRVIIEGTHKAPSVQVETGTVLTLRNGYFEANLTETDLQHSFVKVLGGATILGCHFGSLGAAVTQVDISPSANSPFNRVLNSSFGGDGRAILLGAWAQFAQICGNVVRDAGSSTVDAITVTNGYAQILGNMLYSSGPINFSGAGGIISHNHIYGSLAASGTEITAPAGTVIEGNYGWGSGTFAWDPVNLGDGAGVTSDTISVPGASFGDFVEVAAPYDLQGILCNGYVSSAGNVRIRLQNETGGAIDLSSTGTWKVRLRRG